MSTNKAGEYPLCPLCKRPMAVVLNDSDVVTEYYCEKHGDFQKITLLVPVKILEFLKAMELNLGMTMKKYLELNIIKVVGADLDSWETFNPSPEALIQHYGLKEILKDTPASHYC